MTSNSQEKIFWHEKIKENNHNTKQTKNRTKPETHKGLNLTPYAVHKTQDRSQNAPMALRVSVLNNITT